MSLYPMRHGHLEGHKIVEASQLSARKVKLVLDDDSVITFDFEVDHLPSIGHDTSRSCAGGCKGTGWIGPIERPPLVPAAPVPCTTCNAPTFRKPRPGR